MESKEKSAQDDTGNLALNILQGSRKKHEELLDGLKNLLNSRPEKVLLQTLDQMDQQMRETQKKHEAKIVRMKKELEQKQKAF